MAFESVRQKYDNFCPQLITKLPMTDAIFKAYLVKEGLFSGGGDLKGQVDAKATSAEKAAHFLEKAISPSITDDEFLDLDPLYKLLDVMEKHGGVVKTLAAKIKAAIPNSSSTSTPNIKGKCHIKRLEIVYTTCLLHYQPQGQTHMHTDVVNKTISSLWLIPPSFKKCKNPKSTYTVFYFLGCLLEQWHRRSVLPYSYVMYICDLILES